MQANFRPHRLVRAKTFILAAASYWLTVYPRICIQSRHWSHRAREIPDPILRDLALQAKRAKRGNVEGSAAFAAFAPGPQRAAVIQAQVAFQCAYDYLDTLAEQAETPAPEENALQLHQALLVALDPQRTHLDYYAFQQHKEDAGYLTEIVDTCRRALDRLTSRQTIAAAALRFGDRIVAYQSRNLTEAQGGHRQLCRWATAVTPPGSDLRWWETAASAGSSLGLFALIAAAGRPNLSLADVDALENAYWPWAGALHSLLDSLADEAEDRHTGQRSLLDYYDRPEIAKRLALVAGHTRQSLRAFSRPVEQLLILTAMVAFYSSDPHASATLTSNLSRRLGAMLGGPPRACELVFRVRRLHLPRRPLVGGRTAHAGRRPAELDG